MAIVKSCSVDLKQFSSATVAFVSPSGFCVCSGGGIAQRRCKTCSSVPNFETVKNLLRFSQRFAMSPFSCALPQRPLLSGLQKTGKLLFASKPFGPPTPIRSCLHSICYSQDCLQVRHRNTEPDPGASNWGSRWKTLNGTKLLGAGTSYWWLSREKRRKSRKSDRKRTDRVCNGLLILLFLLWGNKLISPHGPGGPDAVHLIWNIIKRHWSISAQPLLAPVHPQFEFLTPILSYSYSILLFEFLLLLKGPKTVSAIRHRGNSKTTLKLPCYYSRFAFVKNDTLMQIPWISLISRLFPLIF